MAWTRILNIYVGTNTDLPPSGTCADVDYRLNHLGEPGWLLQLTGLNPDTGEQSLDADIDVKRSNRIAHNSATAKVFNLNEQQRNFMDDVSVGKILRIDAGYQDQGFGTIFIGQVALASSTYLTSGDWETEIQASGIRSRTMEFETLHVSVSYATGTLLSKIIQDLAGLLNLDSVFGITNAGFPISGRFVYTGPMGKCLELVRGFLRAKSKDMFFDLSQLVVYNTGAAGATTPSDFETVFLDPASGLLKAERVIHDVKDWRLQVRPQRAQQKAAQSYDKNKSPDGTTRSAQNLGYAEYRAAEAKRRRSKVFCLLNPRVRPNCPVTLKGSPIDGTYIIDDVHIVASTYADHFDMALGVSEDAQ